MLQWEHSALLSTFIKQLFVIKILVLSIFEWPLKTGFTVTSYLLPVSQHCKDLSVKHKTDIVSTEYSGPKTVLGLKCEENI